eukprot:4398034-Lingulodinium_polyedra.AAC.1
MSPAYPFDSRVPARTQACGRTGSLDYNLLIVLDHPRVLRDYKVWRNATGHLVTQQTITPDYIS